MSIPLIRQAVTTYISQELVDRNSYFNKKNRQTESKNWTVDFKHKQINRHNSKAIINENIKISSYLQNNKISSFYLYIDGSEEYIDDFLDNSLLQPSIINAIKSFFYIMGRYKYKIYSESYEKCSQGDEIYRTIRFQFINIKNVLTLNDISSSTYYHKNNKHISPVSYYSNYAKMMSQSTRPCYEIFFIFDEYEHLYKNEKTISHHNNFGKENKNNKIKDEFKISMRDGITVKNIELPKIECLEKNPIFENINNTLLNCSLDEIIPLLDLYEY